MLCSSYVNLCVGERVLAPHSTRTGKPLPTGIILKFAEFDMARSCMTYAG